MLLIADLLLLHPYSFFISHNGAWKLQSNSSTRASCSSQITQPLSNAGYIIVKRFIYKCCEHFLSSQWQENRGHYSKAYINPKTSGKNEAEASVLVADEDCPVAIEYTLLNDISEELKQFEELTSATSSGFAKVMSTHFVGVSIFPHVQNQNPFQTRTQNQRSRSRSRSHLISLPTSKQRGKDETYRVKCSPMNGRLNNLNSRIVAHLDRGIHR